MRQWRPGYLVLVVAVAAALSGAAGAADVVQYSYDAAHSGSVAEAPSFPLTLLWKFAQPPEESTAAPIVAENTVFWAAGPLVVAIDPDSGGAKWSVKAAAPVFGSPVYHSGKVIVGTDTGTVLALNSADGKVAWQAEAGSAVHCPLTLDGETVYCCSRDGKVFALDAATGAQRWTTTLPEAIYAAPAVAGGMVYAVCFDKKLYGISADRGQIRFGFALPSKVASYLEPVVGGRFVYVAAEKSLCAVGLKGVPGWSVQFDEPLPAGPSYRDGTVYQPGPDGFIYAFDADSGKLTWKKPAGMYLSSGLTLAGKTMLTASDSALVRAYDIATGEPLWEYNTWHPLEIKANRQTADYIAELPPVVANGAVYIATAAGELMKLVPGGFDATPPEVFAMQPAEGKPVSAKTAVKVSAAVFDEGSGLDTSSLSVTVDGQPVKEASFSPLGSEFEAQTEAQLADGWHTAEIRAKDAQGNEVVRSWKFLVDSNYTPPAPPAAAKSQTTAGSTRSGLMGGRGGMMGGNRGMVGNRSMYGRGGMQGGMYGRGMPGAMYGRGGSMGGRYGSYGRGSGSSFGRRRGF